jgi:hypothetical protein
MFVADDAFGLSKMSWNLLQDIIKNHHERILNYRLRKTRRIEENVSGFLSAVFRASETYGTESQQRQSYSTNMYVSIYTTSFIETLHQGILVYL